MVEPSSLSFRCFLLAAITALIVVPATARAADLSLYLKKRGPALHVRAVTAFDTSEYAIEPQAGMIQKLVQIYDLIERRPEDSGTLGQVGDFMGKQYRAVRGLIPFWKDAGDKPSVESSLPESDTLERLLSEAGALLFGPIETQMAIASRVEFVITKDCLFYPFDVLHVGGVPLFLKKPVAYSFAPTNTTPPQASAAWRGLIISDADEDPEKGAAAVTSSFPGAFGFDAQNIRREDIEAISSVDFILVSADGGIHGIEMQHMVLRPETLSRLKPELVYFDCNLYGLNMEFINHFNQSGVASYVAPIFSRQTGAASAKTMIRFFRTLRNGDRPSRALYLARKTLYDSYLLESGDKLVAIRSSFPFRAYQLN